MNKPNFSFLLFLICFLTACGASSGPQSASAIQNETLSMEIQLVLGTLQLEGTNQAITGEQAKELLPMWQVYQSLTSNGAAAQAELDGLVEQIQETMTAGQTETIAAMNLTQQDIFGLMQEQGVGLNQAQTGTSAAQGNAGFTPPDGGLNSGTPPDAGMAGGAPPDAGIDGMGVTGPVVSTNQSQGAEASTSVERSAGIPSVLVQALIQLLEQKAEF